MFRRLKERAERESLSVEELARRILDDAVAPLGELLRRISAEERAREKPRDTAGLGAASDFVGPPEPVGHMFRRLFANPDVDNDEHFVLPPREVTEPRIDFTSPEYGSDD